MNPLDALSTIGNVQMPGGATQGLQTLQGLQGQQASALQNPQGASPVSEAFQNMLQPLQNAAQTGAAGANGIPSIPQISISGADGPSTWGHMVQQMVMDVNAKQTTAAQKVSDVLQGGPTPVHDAMVASEEASLSFQFLGEMRNKIVDAYQQVMQMQV
jgi:flagellar hook-basal body complex protein FliE